MRPGHCAPEKVCLRCFAAVRCMRFNEAGALCPGKSRRSRRAARSAGRFNEAGALCPGKRLPRQATWTV